MTLSQEEQLRKIQDSLKEPEPSTPTPVARKAPVNSAADLTQALMQLPQIALQLEQLTDAARREVDYVQVITKLDSDIRSVAVSSEATLKETRKLQADVAKELEHIRVSDAKFNNLIERVGTVLDGLERFLK